MWDTVASYGLTPFVSDSIDYEEVSLSVQDTAHTNYVVGIGTVMWKFTSTLVENQFICLSYGTIFSPQTYHQIHGGEKSIVKNRSCVIINVPCQGP